MKKAKYLINDFMLLMLNDVLHIVCYINIIKIVLLVSFFNVTTRKSEIIHEAHVMFLLKRDRIEPACNVSCRGTENSHLSLIG